MRKAVCGKLRGIPERLCLVRFLPRYLLIMFVSLFCAAWGGAAQQPALMPMPAHVALQDGGFVLQKTLHVQWAAYRDPLLDRAVDRFFVRLSQRTGILFSRHTPGREANALTIRCDGNDSQYLTLHADESYELNVTSRAIELHAVGPTGVLRGLATLLQLVEASDGGYAFQAAKISDKPRFAWRGILIDVSRHFIPLPDLERQLDAMELLKLNVLHLHLTDNESFSIESLRYPQLQQKGAADGAYYTQAQILNFVQEARDRGIRVVPEFDVPAHTRSWFAGYPELQSRPQLQDDGHGAKSGVLDPTNPRVYEFLNHFLAEMSGLFPDQYVHMGGDELAAPHWNKDSHIQQYMQTHAMPDAAALQAVFTQRMERVVRSKRRIMMGWDETLSPKIPNNIVIEVWHKTKVATEAIRLGHPVVVASFYYLDLLRSSEEYYSSDPFQATDPDSTSAECSLVLGGEAAMWTELVTPEMLDAALWPRTAAIAERLWSPREIRDVEDMYRRLDQIDSELEISGIRQHLNRLRMIARLSPADTQTVLTLADALEPVKGYARWHIVKKLSEPPIQNSLLDALYPENLAARRFVGTARSYTTRHDTWQYDELYGTLLQWRSNHAAFEGIARRTPALHPYLTSSLELSDLANIGLESLDALQRGCELSDEWTKNAKSVMARQRLEADEKSALPSLTVIAIEPGIEELVQATIGPRTSIRPCEPAVQ